MDQKKIAEMSVGDAVLGFYILKNAVLKTTFSNKPFLSAKIQDASGSLDMVIWDYTGPIGKADSNHIVKIMGTVTEYKDALQVSVNKIRLATDTDEIDVAALAPVAPIQVDEALSKVKKLIASIEDADYRRVAEALLDRNLAAFRNIPAAKSVHHAFLHGLLMHTCDMMEDADFLAGKYKRIINRSLLLAGALAHDLEKSSEFAFSELGLVTDYTVKGQLLGHLVMGAQKVAVLCAELGIPEEKSILLQHLILSHHQEPEWGAAVRPQCAEAELLSYIDLIDSRMEIYAETLDSVPAGSFSDRVFALDGRRLYRHN